jgi:hypothetical protein
MIMQVKLSRRWGPHREGRTVEVSDSQGEWLIRNNYAESAGDIQAPVQNAAAPGGHGADPLAGADATRLRPRVGRPPRDERLNYAASAPGSSPTYRAGFNDEASKRQGPAGRDQLSESGSKPSEGSSQDGDSAKRPAKRRSKSEA